MNTNDILYKIQKALNLSSDEILKAYELANYPMDAEHLDALVKRRFDKGFVLCSYEELGVFLDGLVVLKRGPSPKKYNEEDVVELSNNLILKKLRIALELKEAETEIIFNLADINLTKQELKSLFRKEGHKNFKYCSDSLLVSFLDGLDEFNYIGVIE